MEPLLEGIGKWSLKKKPSAVKIEEDDVVSNLTPIRSTRVNSTQRRSQRRSVRPATTSILKNQSSKAKRDRRSPPSTMRLSPEIEQHIENLITHSRKGPQTKRKAELKKTMEMYRNSLVVYERILKKLNALQAESDSLDNDDFGDGIGEVKDGEEDEEEEEEEEEDNDNEDESK